MERRAFHDELNEIRRRAGLAESPPLPTHWDKKKFRAPTRLKDMLDYALTRGSDPNSGTSRMAFTVPYKGRQTILKVAINESGLEQNAVEARLLSDPFVRHLGITIPLIDYDTESPQPRWIHTEKAEPITDEQLHIALGLPKISSLYYLLDRAEVGTNTEQERQWIKTNDLLANLVELMVRYNLGGPDLSMRENWGIYKGKPMLIDVGLSRQVQQEYY